MGLMQRNKGRRAQTAAGHLLTDRDWRVIDLSGGKKSEDIIAEDPQGRRFSVEVKNHRVISLSAFLSQAREQAKERKLPWMLMARLDGFKSWLVLRQGEGPQIWHEKEQNGTF